MQQFLFPANVVGRRHSPDPFTPIGGKAYVDDVPIWK
jgi:hypothetical protein